MGAQEHIDTMAGYSHEAAEKCGELVAAVSAINSAVEALGKQVEGLRDAHGEVAGLTEQGRSEMVEAAALLGQGELGARASALAMTAQEGYLQQADATTDRILRLLALVAMDGESLLGSYKQEQERQTDRARDARALSGSGSSG